MVLAMTFAAFPHAVMILLAALALSDARLYEAADSLGTSRVAQVHDDHAARRAATASSRRAMVVFTMAVSEFGVPKVIGGNYNVLAVDIYKQVIGQQNFHDGRRRRPDPAACRRWSRSSSTSSVRRRQQALLTARSVPYAPRPARGARPRCCWRSSC